MRVDRKTKGSQTMIRWRLRMLMAEKKISNKELAELSDIHPTSISKLKNVDEIEQISGRVLNNLCNGLTKAYRARGEDRIITPGDLFDYTFDGDGDSSTSANTQISVQKPVKDKQLSNSKGVTQASAKVVWVSSEKSA
jgi:DNA-binding Xre family transcriptional regulator